MSERIECPAKLIEQLRPVQERINRMQTEIQAALFGAQMALGVADDWVWDGAGWVSPEKSTSEISPQLEESAAEISPQSE